MRKSQVYSWRISRDLKQELEEKARDEGTTISALLERIVEDWLAEARSGVDEEAAERRLRAAAAPSIGSIHGGDPRRSREVRSRVRERLRARRR